MAVNWTVRGKTAPNVCDENGEDTEAGLQSAGVLVSIPTSTRETEHTILLYKVTKFRFKTFSYVTLQGFFQLTLARHGSNGKDGHIWYMVWFLESMETMEMVKFIHFFFAFFVMSNKKLKIQYQKHHSFQKEKKKIPSPLSSSPPLWL